MSVVGLASSIAAQQAWVDGALCAQVDIGDLWFPEKGSSPQEAKKVCEVCPVRAECLRYAMQRNEQFGVWGGLSERERRQLRAGELVRDPTHCFNNHDMEVVGRHRNGQCSQCSKDRNKRYEKRVREQRAGRRTA